ncbi:hypothetical protein FF38_08557 [Lucilia cuprina]|uniref:Uncharacterized protein n=1 Tax=Lucilia cuprina TaxID=7375 RepID=A0A0L0CBZ2_LUCCU|nr:hypothetical protein FF38_08557 [Lucilia cuprina]
MKSNKGVCMASYNVKITEVITVGLSIWTTVSPRTIVRPSIQEILFPLKYYNIIFVGVGLKYFFVKGDPLVDPEIFTFYHIMDPVCIAVRLSFWTTMPPKTIFRPSTQVNWILSICYAISCSSYETSDRGDLLEPASLGRADAVLVELTRQDDCR